MYVRMYKVTLVVIRPEVMQWEQLVWVICTSLPLWHRQPAKSEQRPEVRGSLCRSIKGTYQSMELVFYSMKCYSRSCCIGSMLYSKHYWDPDTYLQFQNSEVDLYATQSSRTAGSAYYLACTAEIQADPAQLLWLVKDVWLIASLSYIPLHAVVDHLKKVLLCILLMYVDG